MAQLDIQTFARLVEDADVTAIIMSAQPGKGFTIHYRRHHVEPLVLARHALECPQCGTALRYDNMTLICHTCAGGPILMLGIVSPAEQAAEQQK